MDFDIIVKEGKIVTENEVYEADIGIKDGKITHIAKTIEAPAAKVVKAKGKLVLPGLVDGHTHMEMPFMGTTTADDFESGTRSAAFGGVTTIVDFALQAKGETLFQTINAWRAKADPKACVDFSFHMVVRDLNETVLGEIKKVIEYGVSSFKIFMTYKKEGLWLDDGSIYRVMSEAAKYGGLVGLHCENADLIDCLVSLYLSEGKTAPEYHAKSRPPKVEIEAAQRGIMLAEMAGANMYIVHMSTGGARDTIYSAYQRGVPVFSETCPHYLVFTEERYRSPDGANYVMSPPLRPKEDKEAMWVGLQRGYIKTVASDHAAFTIQQKGLGRENFSKIPNGVGGTEVILPILYSEGVRKGVISLNRLVQVASYNPAKLYGLYPAKGAIMVGSDADLVILDPELRLRLSQDNLHSRQDHSIYDDVVVTGVPVATIARGQMVVEDRQFVGRPGHGRFVPGKPNPAAVWEI